MLRWQSRGELLRWWRDKVVGISQRALAEKLGVARTAVTNWENGDRMASVDVERIDQALNADGVLAGWLWSFETPKGLEARQVWSNVYSGPSTPVWMWIRCPEAKIVVEGEWGLYRFEQEVELGENGLLVTVGVSADESPVVVQLSAPGWIDFGRGAVPPDVPGATQLDALTVVMPSSATGDFSAMLSSNIARRFSESPTPEVVELGDKARRPLEALVDRNKITYRAARRQDEAGGLWPPISDGLLETDQARFQTLREARGLSLAEASQRLAELTETKASKDTLRRFENGVGLPKDRLLPAALDHVLGANGHLALADLSSGQGSASIKVPSYWSAPVWIEFWADQDTPCAEPGGQRIAELYWGSWRRSIDAELPLLVICHAPLRPLKIVADRSVCWTVGVGRREGAIPINQRWLPDSIDTTHNALSEYQSLLFELLRQADERDEE